MTAELQEILNYLTDTDWAPGPSQQLVEGIEERIVALIPSRLRYALENEEAAKRRGRSRGSAASSWQLHPRKAELLGAISRTRFGGDLRTPSARTR